MFRTRFAPSPTGYLHLGGARTALFAYLIAKREEGVFFFRTEDTDRKRLKPEALISLLKTMSILGLDPDEGLSLKSDGFKDSFYGVYQKGDFGPYIQSERLKIYHEHAQRMIDRRLAYWSFLNENDKEELIQIKAATKKPINFYQINLERFGQEQIFMSLEKALTDSHEPALRFRLQRNQKIDFVDELLGKTVFDLNLEEDHIILKSDGFPTYHLAHLIDDELMQTSLIIRSQEWYPSTPLHMTLFADYWGKVPKYMHIPFILGQNGNKKMSKRDGNVNVQDYLDQGFLPEAIINYLAFLGWNPGNEQELFLERSDFVD